MNPQNTRILREQLADSESPHLRIAAAEDLARGPFFRSSLTADIEALREALHDPDFRVPLRLLEGLAHNGCFGHLISPEVAPFLLAEDFEYRFEAAEALRAIGIPPHVLEEITAHVIEHRNSESLLMLALCASSWKSATPQTVNLLLDGLRYPETKFLCGEILGHFLSSDRREQIIAALIDSVDFDDSLQLQVVALVLENNGVDIQKEAPELAERYAEVRAVARNQPESLDRDRTLDVAEIFSPTEEWREIAENQGLENFLFRANMELNLSQEQVLEALGEIACNTKDSYLRRDSIFEIGKMVVTGDNELKAKALAALERLEMRAQSQLSVIEWATRHTDPFVALAAKRAYTVVESSYRPEKLPGSSGAA